MHRKAVSSARFIFHLPWLGLTLCVQPWSNDSHDVWLHTMIPGGKKSQGLLWSSQSRIPNSILEPVRDTPSIHYARPFTMCTCSDYTFLMWFHIYTARLWVKIKQTMQGVGFTGREDLTSLPYCAAHNVKTTTWAYFSIFCLIRLLPLHNRWGFYVICF